MSHVNKISSDHHNLSQGSLWKFNFWYLWFIQWSSWFYAFGKKSSDSQYWYYALQVYCLVEIKAAALKFLIHLYYKSQRLSVYIVTDLESGAIPYLFLDKWSTKHSIVT